MIPKHTEEEKIEKERIFALSKALHTSDLLWKKLKQDVYSESKFKCSDAKINSYIDDIRNYIDSAYLVSRKERIKRDLKRCCQSMLFLGDK